MFSRLASISLLLVSLFMGQVIICQGDYQTHPSLIKRDVDLGVNVQLQSIFGQLQTHIQQAHSPLETACKAKDSKAVVNLFNGLQKSFQNVASSCSKVYNINPAYSLEFGISFCQVMTEFQVLLKTIQGYPELLKGCSRTFKSTSTNINAMISFLHAGNVDLASLFTQFGQAPDLNLYSQCGFQINA